MEIAMTPRPADGHQLLTEVRDWLDRYLRTMHADDLILLTVWAAHTHLVEETYTTPRLLLDSPMPGSGKTTCLEHLQRLCRRPVQMAAVSSPALLVRMLEAEMRTLLIDEADRSLDPKRDGVAELIAVLNSGYKRGATRPVLVPVKGGGWEPREMSTFAPVAIAGNGPNLPEDTQSRIIRVLLMPDLDGRAQESDWELIEHDAIFLGERLGTWASLVRDDVRLGIRPDLPGGVVARFREKWLPLKRVAAQAGPEWADAIDRMALHDREQWAQDQEDGLVRERPAVALAKHLRQVWRDHEDFVPTATIIGRLIEAYPETWGPSSSYGTALTAQRFGRMLVSSYKINSAREGHGTPRGYRRQHLEGVWNRLGLTPGGTGSTGSSGETGEITPPPSPVSPDQPVEPVRRRPPEGAGGPTCTDCSAPLVNPFQQRQHRCNRCQITHLAHERRTA